jgi:hypothetical protein
MFTSLCESELHNLHVSAFLGRSPIVLTISLPFLCSVIILYISKMGGKDTRVHLTDDPGNESLLDVENIAQTNKEGISIFLQFTEPRLAGEFNVFQKTESNPPLSIAIGACMFIYFIVHLRYQYFWQTKNPFYIPAFILGLVVGGSGTLLLTIRYALVIPTSFFRSPLLRRMHTTILDLDKSRAIFYICNTSLVISLSIASSLFVLARVMEGPCDPNDMDWRAQQDCNNSPLTGLPTEEYVFDLISVVLVQIFVKGANRKSLLFAWVGKFAIIMACLSVTGAMSHAWVCLHFALVGGISYEVSVGWYVNSERFVLHLLFNGICE